MKKILSLLALAALTIGLLGSCSKINERLDNLEKEVSGIENEQIASINSQIDGIKTSIADLGTIRSDISSLKQSASDHSVDIFNLEEADRALKDRILNLEDYVDAVLPNYAEKEWVEATFSTLEQYEATCDTIAKIDARIGALDAKLSNDIKATADSLTKWVNKQFEGYYTAAEMDAKLAQMKAAVDSSKASGKITDAKADSIATELTNAKAAVDTAKANIRAEYKAAVKAAIEESEGKLTKEITEAITTVNTAITNLTTRVTKLEKDVTALTGRVEKLEGMIQSVTIVPAYSDGSVEIANDSLYIDCIVSPVSAVSGLTKANFKVLVNKVLTKAVDVKTISITEDKWFSMNVQNGTVSIKVPVNGYIPENADSTITVAVKVNYVHSTNLASDYTTEFVPVTLPVSVSLDKHSIVVPFSTTSRDTTLVATVKNAKDNSVTWTSSNTNIATVDANGKVTINANASGKDTIVVKTVEGNATDTCFVTVLPQGTLPGVFSVSATKKVHFSPGNLVATIDASSAPTAWKFHEHQYDTLGRGGANKTIGSAAGDVDLFGWSTSDGGTSTTDNYGIKTSFNGNDYPGDFYDWGKAVGDGSTWRTLSKDEWTYLLATRTMTNSKARYSNAINGVTIGGTTYKGLFLYPDDYNGEVVSSSMTWDEINAAGIVFLPAAGSRSGSNVHDVGSKGLYWSSTDSDSGSGFAYSTLFDSVEVFPLSNGRDCGCSVRLVTE